tara:strand:- start:353 stop:529 length:177 start_codon:yes stop_codon:yes gene_type:complete
MKRFPEKIVSGELITPGHFALLDLRQVVPNVDSKFHLPYLFKSRFIILTSLQKAYAFW